MSGHSKWSSIKRQKGVNDVKRGAAFTKVAREVAMAARAGGGDPDGNFRLRLAIEKARAVNMPADNIKRAIERATGAGETEQFEEIVYEGYGPGGVAILVEAATDNRNRTAAEVRSRFVKSGGVARGIRAPSPGSSRCAGSSRSSAPGWIPTRSPWRRSTRAPRTSTPDADPIEIYTAPADLEGVRKRLEAAGHRRRRGRVGDDRQADRRARLEPGAPGPAPRRGARGASTTSSG